MATTPSNDSKKKLISLYDMERLANAIELMHSQDVSLLVQEILGLDEEKASQEDLQAVEAMLDGRSLRYVTQEEYDALPENEKFDDTIAWCILTEDGESINLEAIQKYVDDAIENASLEVDIDTATSDNLNTQDKTIVGAINELELEMFEAKADIIALDEHKLEQEDLPCYDNREYKMTTLTYDGNSEGKDVVLMDGESNVQFSYVKITDDISEYDIEGLKNGTMVGYEKYNSGEELELDFNAADYAIIDYGNAYLVGESVLVVPCEEAEIEELGVSVTKGIWFVQVDVENGSSISYIKSLTYNKCFGELKKIDEKYLPQEVLPCYDTRITERKTYTHTVSDTPNDIKISDDIYTVEEIKNFSNLTITIDYMDDTASETYDYLTLSELDYSLIFMPDPNSGDIGAAYIGGGIVCIVLKDTEYSSAGIYLTEDVISSNCTIEFSFDYLLSGEIKALDEKYLVNKPGRIVCTPCPDGCGDIFVGEIFNSSFNKACGALSHAEGATTIANGMSAHAEGLSTKAMNVATHAEGFFTEANGLYSHAEGHNTIANGEYQHVQGKYNAPLGDSYAHIVGNGTASNVRSNAHTLDWNGNAWFAGKATVSVQPTDNNDLTTKLYVDNAIAQASIGGEIDTTGFALKTELPTKTSQLTNDSGFITSIPSEYITSSELEQTLVPYGEEFNEIRGLIEGNYAKKSELFSKNYNDLTNKPVIPSIEGLATKSYVDQSISQTNEGLQNQINELFQNVSNGKELIASAITDKGVNASEEETFQSLSEKINQIPVGPPGSNIIGYVNENNDIYVSLTELESGTYTLKFEDYTGLLNEFDDIGTVEV